MKIPKCLFALAILSMTFCGCCSVANSSDSMKDRQALNGTAFSRSSDGRIINAIDNGCSYRLDGAGTFYFSYDAMSLETQVTINSSENYDLTNTGVFISEQKTALAFATADNSGPITVKISDDNGVRWKDSSIPVDRPVSWTNIGFTSKQNGWLIVCSFEGMGRELHTLYQTSDGGATWTQSPSDIDEKHARVLTGAGFINPELGFLCFRNESSFSPVVWRTQDGGIHWSPLSIDMPKAYKNAPATALSAFYDGTQCVLPVLFSAENEEPIILYFTSDDGNTFSLNEI